MLNRFVSDHRVRVQISSRLTGDVVDINAVESGEIERIFQFDLATEESTNKNLADQTLQTVKRDQAQIRLTDCLDRKRSINFKAG